MSLQNTFKLTRFLFMKNTLKSYTSFLGIYNLLYESQIMFLYFLFFFFYKHHKNVSIFLSTSISVICYLHFFFTWISPVFISQKKNHTFKVHFHKFTYSYILCIPHAPPNEHLFTRIKKMQFHITYK